MSGIAPNINIGMSTTLSGKKAHHGAKNKVTIHVAATASHHKRLGRTGFTHFVHAMHCT